MSLVYLRMPKTFLFSALLAVSVPFFVAGQSVNKQTLEVPLLHDGIEINGMPDEALWQQAAHLTELTKYFPDSGETPDGLSQDIFLFYSESGLYIGFHFKDEQSEVLGQLTTRDNFSGNSDYIHLRINPFNDGANDFNFYLTAAGVQADSKSTAINSDFGWNGVWESKVQLTKNEWSGEIFIPYRVLRMPRNIDPEKPTDWGFNVVRYRRSDRTQYCWNYIDRNFNNESLQSGLLKGIAVKNPPKRINLRPNTTGVIQRGPAGSLRYSGAAGADIKVGINKSFTLDMTLLPDFSQVAYDQQFVNFGAFERQFDENRQFFKEGVNLFNKGNLFYSRRIGGNPKNFTNANLDQLSNSTQSFTRMLNATKVTGTTDHNLSVGFLNAITAANYISGLDSNGLPVSVLTEPLTNYNVVAVDQRLGGNNSIGLINTSVVRQNSGFEARDARATALTTNLNLLKNTHFINATLAQSSVTETANPHAGLQLEWTLGKQKGAWRWDHFLNVTTPDFDPNDMGFLQRANSIHQNFRIYNVLQRPTKRYIRRTNSLLLQYRRLYDPNVFERIHLEFSHFGLTKSFFAYGYNAEVRPEDYDFFDPRVWGRYRINPASIWQNAWISTDFRKPLAVEATIGHWQWADWGAHGIYGDLSFIVRVNDRFNFRTALNLGNNHQVGWAQTLSTDSVGMALRDRKELAQSLSGQYLFGPNSYLSLNVRHTWNRIENENIFHLTQQGRLVETDAYIDPNLNINIFNLDLKYVLWFAPGRELNLLYRASLAQADDQTQLNYFNNIHSLTGQAADQVFSVRLVYFLDYAEIVK